MALGELQLIRQNMLHLHVKCTHDTSFNQVLDQQMQRQQRWADSMSIQQRSQDFCSAIACVEAHTSDRVFARQLVAFKVLATFNNSSTKFCSIIDSMTRFQLGHKSVSNHGFLVSMNPEDALKAQAVMPAQRQVALVVVRVIVSGCGARLGSQYLFPEMTPVAVAYLCQ